MRESKFRYINDEECNRIRDLSLEIQKLSQELLKIASAETRRAYSDGHIHTHEGKRLHRGYIKIYEGALTCVGAVDDCRKKPFLSKEDEE